MDQTTPPEEKEVLRSIEVLNRTRESLSADVLCSNREGQLLDKALAKQLARREAQLDSFLQRNVSVIVRTSTPNPDTTCENNCSNQFFPTPNTTSVPHVPEDNNLPLRTFLHDLSHNPEDQPHLPPRHPTLLAPTEPWTPPRRESFDLQQESRQESFDSQPESRPREPLLNLLSSSDTAPLLHPLFAEGIVLEEASSKGDLVMSGVNEAQKNAVNKVKKFRRVLVTSDPAGLDPSAVARHYKHYHDTSLEALHDLMEAVEDLLDEHGHELSAQDSDSWKAMSGKCNQEFKELMNKLEKTTKETEAVASMVPILTVPPPGTQPSAVATPGAPTALPQGVPTQSNAGQLPQKTRAAQVEVDVDADIVAREGKKLTAEININQKWEELTDHEIEIAMGKIGDWKKRFDKIEEKGWNIKRNTGSFNLNEDKLRSTQAMIATLEQELEFAIQDIESEDKKRCLYSTSKSKTATVKFPTFGGGQDEDFFKFEREVKKGFLTNRIRRGDQVGKLRECLRNHPRTMIPASMEDIEEAWNVLKTVYGDAARLMKVKKANISALGRMPKNESNAAQLRSQVEWLLKLELNLQDIFDLGSQDINMERAAYSPDMIDTITRMFSFDNQVKLSKLDKSDSKVKLEEMQEFIIELRNERQDLLAAQEVSKASSGGNCRGTRGGDGYGGGPNRQRHVTEAAIAYRPPRLDEKCRICLTLEAEGITEDLYEDHTHNVASGCPKLAAMPRVDKEKYIKKAKICPNCFDADYIMKQNSFHGDCPIKVKEEFFTCKGQGCKKHYFICGQHVKMNESKLKGSVLYWSRQGKVFANIARVFNTSRKNVARENSPRNEAKNTLNPQKEESFDVKLQATVEAKEYCIEDATRKLKEVVKGSTVVDIPEGEPLFLFSSAVGKTRPVKIFYDRGCSHVVFRHGVPGKELEGVMTKKGPLSIKGVGDTKVKVMDEWACLLDRADGCKQVVQGVAVEKITSTFPNVNVTKAVKEVKAAAPCNKILQKLRIPELAGGEPDVLLGIFMRIVTHKKYTPYHLACL